MKPGFYILLVFITLISLPNTSHCWRLCSLWPWTECETSSWIAFKPDFSEMKSRLFGQHIVYEVVTKAITEHLAKEAPTKALVLSFHGSTGTGKTHVSKLIARALYRKYREKGESRFFHRFESTHKISEADMTKDLLDFINHGLIQGGERSLFILEEIDKRPPQFLDVLIPYLEAPIHIPPISGPLYDARKAIFILFSNAGAANITAQVIKHRQAGHDRSKIGYFHFEALIDSEAFTFEGPLKDSALVSRAFIDRFVPFLPLEREHVKQCTIAYLTDVKKYPNPLLKPGPAFLEQIADQMQYTDETGVYLTYGCKRVETTVDVLL